MNDSNGPDTVSTGWKIAPVVVIIVELVVLFWISAVTYESAPPIPESVVTPSGQTLYSGRDIREGQEIFLRHGLMENGSIWGHGAYIGPDFTADYLHTLAVDSNRILSHELYRSPPPGLSPGQRDVVRAETIRLLKENRYDPAKRILSASGPEEGSFRLQIAKWREYFERPELSRGLLRNQIRDPEEIRKLTAFFAWTAWAAAVNRPGLNYSYTNNFPYDPLAGNLPTGDAVLWSALSLIVLLAGTAIVLFSFGRFKFLGWRPAGEHIRPEFIPGVNSPGQKAVMKFYLLAAGLFLVQVLVGGMTAHYRADPGSFYGLDTSRFVPGNIFRTWHLQTALLWITTCMLGGGLFLSAAFGREVRGQARGINLLFWALAFVAAGSLIGEGLGIFQLTGSLWFWFGNQGWEYLDLGRGWQYLLAGGIVFWVFLLVRQIGPSMIRPGERELPWLFFLSAAAIPVFYLPALIFWGATNFSIVDHWRFWIIHLWVEYILEFFVTVMVAVFFFKLGLVSKLTAKRVIYLDAILFPAGGILGIGHHWYWTGGQPAPVMAISAAISALEVVPLILLTLDAWDFISLTRDKKDTGISEKDVPHKWTFYFLMAVGFWNFVGAGIFGFLINMPIISYFQAGTTLTANHGHSALMGVFGMFAVSFMVMGMRQVLPDPEWAGVRKYVRLSFWGLNIGLLLMVVLNLFPGGVLQLLDVLENGYWHARGPEFLDLKLSRGIEWARLPADLIFILLGVVPLCIALVNTWRCMNRKRREESAAHFGKGE